MTVDEQLTTFNDLLRKLTVEYDIFFAGGRKLPPTSLRFKVENQIKRLLETPMNFGQKFKYNQLVAKYSLYRDLWRRNMQEMEEGGKLRSEEEIKRVLQIHRADEARAEQAPERMALMVNQPAAEAEEMMHLFRFLLELRRRHGEKSLNIDFEKFRNLVAQKTAEVRSSHLCESAQFVVFYDPEQERVRFQVKVKRGEGPDANQTLTGYVYSMIKPQTDKG
jgi:hypothetical protein